MMLNKVTLIGHLGSDPEIRHTQDNRPIVNFNLATSERWKDKSTGEKREATEWHRCVCFHEGLAKVFEQYVKKGSKILIEGSLQTRKWQDKEGHDRWTTEVVMKAFNSTLVLLDNKPGGGSDPDQQNNDSNYGSQSGGDYGAESGRQEKQSGGQGGQGNPDIEDEIPFAMEWR